MRILPCLVLAVLPLVACRAPAPRPVRFGVLADVQYADKPAAGERRYASSLARLERAVDALNAEEGLDFVVQVGDLIDGRDGVDGSREDLAAVLAVLARLEVPLVHVLGNHCLEVPRDELEATLGVERGYRSFVEGGWRFLVLDSMALSVVGVEEGDPRRAAGEAWLAAHPKAEHPEAARWNGGLGGAQTGWLTTQLVDAAAAAEPVVCFAHHPVLAEASTEHHLAWDHDEVAALLEAAETPVLWVNGHDHAGGYAARGGVHHLTLRGMVEAPAQGNRWAVVELWPDRILVRGFGDEPARELLLE